MSAFSNYLENALLNATLRNTTYTSPSAVYVGLFTSDPTDAGTGVEVTGGSYVRKTATFAAPSSGTCATNADVQFDQATADWGLVTHFGIFDASSGGNLLYHGQLTSSKNIETGDVFKINSGNLTVTLA